MNSRLALSSAALDPANQTVYFIWDYHREQHINHGRCTRLAPPPFPARWVPAILHRISLLGGVPQVQHWGCGEVPEGSGPVQQQGGGP